MCFFSLLRNLITRSHVKFLRKRRNNYKNIAFRGRPVATVLQWESIRIVRLFNQFAIVTKVLNLFLKKATLFHQATDKTIKVVNQRSEYYKHSKNGLQYHYT